LLPDRGDIVVFALMLLLALGLPVPEKGLWLDVPFVKQDRNACGAASISMIMQYWSVGDPAAKDPLAIQRLLYSEEAKGIYASDLQQYLQDHGFATFAFKGEWSDLQQHLSRGRPLIVSLGNRARSPLHYVVVVGLDWERERVLLNDPARKKLVQMDRKQFEKSWKSTNNWTLLALPQQQAG
jgi:ABC-type bacteriocin/lantibiotic exporter with double-glycine peptidase domain